MKFLMQEDIPRWYHFFWNSEKQGLFIRVHRFFFANCQHKNLEPYFSKIGDYLDYLPLFDSYEPRVGESRFGVNDSIILVAEDENWLTYQVKIPCILGNSKMACQHCDGTGRRYIDDPECEEPCLSCHGSKTKEVHNYKEVKEVCFSLAIFLNALEFPIDQDVVTPEKQVFIVTSNCIRGSHGHSVGGYASPEFMRFLESFSKSDDESVKLESVEDVMKAVYTRLFGKLADYHRFGFRCYTRGGQVVLSCPGDACEIHTEHNRRVGSDYGEGITCHNLDSGVQQLTLLSGLGMLSSMCDAWSK